MHCCTIFLWDLDWKYSARWEPSIWRCRLLSALQRAEMTNLDQIFCMRYFLCIWRAASKIFVHFLLLLPPQKGRSIRSGCFFQNYRSTVILAWFFPLYKSRNLSPCQKCRTYGNFGRPLQIIQTALRTCSNFSRIIQLQAHVRCIYVMYAAADDNEALQSRLRKYWVAPLQYKIHTVLA